MPALECKPCTSHLNDQGRRVFTVSDALLGDFIAHVIEPFMREAERLALLSNPNVPHGKLSEIQSDEDTATSLPGAQPLPSSRETLPPGTEDDFSCDATIVASPTRSSSHDRSPRRSPDSRSDATQHAHSEIPKFLHLFSEDEVNAVPADPHATCSTKLSTIPAAKPSPRSDARTLQQPDPCSSDMVISALTISTSTALHSAAASSWEQDFSYSLPTPCEPFHVCSADPVLLSRHVRQKIIPEDLRTQAQIASICEPGWLYDAKDLIVLNPLRRGIRQGIASAALSSPTSGRTSWSLFNPVLVWVCMNDAQAEHVFDVFCQMYTLLKNAGLSCSDAAILTSTMCDAEVSEVLVDNPDVVISTETTLINACEAGLIGLDWVKKFVLDNLTLFLSRHEYSGSGRILNYLQPNHNVVALMAQPSSNRERIWKTLTPHLGRKLGDMALMPDTKRSLLQHICKYITFEAYHGSHSDQAEFAVRSLLRRDCANKTFGRRRILALCELNALLRCSVDAIPSVYQQYGDHARFCIVHGRQSAEENEAAFKLFEKHHDNILLGTLESIYGFDYKAQQRHVPVLVLVHLPNMFDELLSIVQWYLSLCMKYGIRPQDNPPSNLALRPRIHILYGQRNVKSLTYFQSVIKKIRACHRAPA